MTQANIIKKKKRILALLVGSYFLLVIYSSLFVPVKAKIANDNTDAVYGYCPIWELKPSTPQSAADNTDPFPPLTIRFNFLAWAIQWLFITGVFFVLLARTLRHFKNLTRQNSANPPPDF